jgi:hypothetical protein
MSSATVAAIASERGVCLTDRLAPRPVPQVRRLAGCPFNFVEGSSNTASDHNPTANRPDLNRTDVPN